MPGGPPASCYVDDATGRRVQLVLAAGAVNSTVAFSGDRDTDLEISSLSLAGLYTINDRTQVRAGAGAVLDGSLVLPDGTGHDVDAGGVIFAGVLHRTGQADGWTPAIDLSGTLGFTWGRTSGPDARQSDYRAADLRVGVQASWPVGPSFFPYAAARVFGGPVRWEIGGASVTGSDVHHYQLAVGSGFALGPVVVFAELAPVGEQGAALGIGSNW
ncbi:MAG: hypothetical protein IPK64_02225 [bacterium]|nr:hypothetical protein [bacterium]